jgi:peptidoglycan/xylan/chitin deacetylase (PgdA/CDA1 family)
MKAIVLSAILTLFACGCQTSSEKTIQSSNVQQDSFACCADHPDTLEVRQAGESLPETGAVPILCYHQVRDRVSTDSKSARVYIVPVATFKEEMKMLHDSGYHTILPDQLIAYINNGEPLPLRSIMLTFDDADGSQVANVLPELDKYGFKGVFFVMTVVLGHPKYMTKEDVKSLAKHGHTIGCHTWDHHIVTKYTDEDWVKQIEKPRTELQQITGAPVKYFAYPYGIWNTAAAARLKQYGFTAAFRLAGRSDPSAPLFSIGRQIVDGNWSAARLLKMISKKEETRSVPVHPL